ncbi:CETP binding protein [Phascolarctid gammaherpesvirus 1]|uniref:CETP binding protein n=1 Tax=Phascolarctid gammaherpesvirus 1 TaxID=2249313 RepID=A0A3S8D7Q7_9GAMA|nr:CETP binding protein [Phascolarctid gammaherpesvirus 1]AZB49205.1 CETP binding protein [Phascolarctid gammaherpesvirus 1]
MVEIKTLINFLNKECLWRCAEDTKKRKVYMATTAVSAVFTPQLEDSTGKEGAMNVTMIRLRQKTVGEYLTIYINGAYVGGFLPYEFIVRNTLEYEDLWMITIRGYSELDSAMFIPECVFPPKSLTFRELSPSIIWDYSRVLTKNEIQELNSQIRQKKISPSKRIGRGGAWLQGNQLILTFLDMDLVACCPGDLVFPSLNSMLNSLTRCTDHTCVPCHGSGLHARVADGVTTHEDIGSSKICPCLLSCEALSKDHSKIKQARHLLPFVFDQKQSGRVMYIGYMDTMDIVTPEDLIFGVGEGGEHIRCQGSSWRLLQLSPILTRIFIYQCQVMKNICLHSY